MADKSLIANGLPKHEKVLSGPSQCESDSTGRVPIATGKFPKSARILTSSHYTFLRRNSSRLFGELISIDIRQGRSHSPKLGLTVSKKYGKAHDRNRFKRVVREAFRELSSSLPVELEMNICPRKSCAPLNKAIILLELRSLLSKFIRP